MLTFKSPFRSDDDDWTPDGPKFTDSKTLAKVAELLEAGRFLIAEHWHYRGSRAPDRIDVEYLDDFVEYPEKNAIAGDVVDIFDLSDGWVSRGKSVVSGKCPDEQGEVPRTGAY